MKILIVISVLSALLIFYLINKTHEDDAKDDPRDWE